MNESYIQEVSLTIEEFEKFTEDTIEKPYTEQVHPIKVTDIRKELKQRILNDPQKEDIEAYLWNYKIGLILSKYPPDLLEYATNIIKTTLELDKKERGTADIDDIIQKIFGTGLVRLRKYNEAREKFNTTINRT